MITSRWKKYHHSWCQTIKGSPRTIMIKQALKRGYKPCGICEPPDHEVTFANSGINWDDEISVYLGENRRLITD